MSSFKIEWNGKKASNNANAGAIEGLTNAAEFLLDESLKLVPIDESTLANSGNTYVDASELTATVSFDTPYAIKQHEDLTLQHKNGRSAKYLETPYKQNQQKLQEIISAAIKDEIGE